MLTKLLKYEGKATAHVLLPIAGGVLAFTIVAGLANAVLNNLGDLPALVNFFQAMLNMIAVLALIFVLGVCIFVNVQRFYKLLGQQGYLMLSLPVPTWKHITAKLICACAWSVAVTAYLILCGCILGGSLADITFNPGDGIVPFSPEGFAIACLFVLILLALLAGTYLEFYLACAIGGQFGQQRLLASIIAYFVLGFVEQILGVFLVIIVAVGAVQANAAGWLELFYNVDSFWAMFYMLAILLAFAVLVDAIKWAVTQWLMTRRLNLV